MSKPNQNVILGLLIPILALLGLVSMIFFQNIPWLPTVIWALLIVCIVAWVISQRKSFDKRTTMMTLASITSVILVFSIVIVVNYLSKQYPKEFDLTPNKKHSLTDQSVKTIKRVAEPMKFVLFAKGQKKEQFRPLLENYKKQSQNLSIEIVDSNKNPLRLAMLGIKNENTLLVTYKKDRQIVTKITEENVTNAVLKLVSGTKRTICFTTGHGEGQIAGSPRDPQSHSGIINGLSNQSYLTQTINIQNDGIPKGCSSVVILGPKRDFFEKEVKTLEEYFNEGGAAVLALDFDLQNRNNNKRLLSFLEKWHIKATQSYVIDPISKVSRQSSPAIPTFNEFSNTHPITKDFNFVVAFPLMRQLEVIANAPKSIKLNWIAKTGPNSWSQKSLDRLTKGDFRFTKGVDVKGPIIAAIAAEGKTKSDAKGESRLAVFSTSGFIKNQFVHAGGNLDLFINALSWTIKDENLISIRKDPTAPGNVTISNQAMLAIQWLTIVILPLIFAVAGIYNWRRRKRL